MPNLVVRICLSLCALLLAVPVARAATYSVFSTQDSGPGTLRQAMLDAQSAGDGSVIEFTAAFPLQGEIQLASALPTMSNSSLVVDGGDRQPQINGQSLYRVFSVDGNNQRLELRDLTLTSGFSDQAGGCVYGGNAGGGGLLIVERVRFEACEASGDSLIHGGAIDWGRELGSLNVSASQFIDNTATATLSNGQSAGGAISTSSNLLASGLLFEGNAAIADDGGGYGGALNLNGSSRSSFISDSTFRYNAASPLSPLLGWGGAITLACDHDCSLQIDRSYLRGNAANGGGAIYIRRTGGSGKGVGLRLYNSSFYNNDARDGGGALLVGLEGHLYSTNSSFYNNSAADGAHMQFIGSAEVNYFIANLLAPGISGNACAGAPGGPAPSTVTTNLLSDAVSCSFLANAMLPATPLGNFSEDESPGQIGVLRFDGSAVIDSIDDAGYCDAEDARAQSRPIDGDGNGVAACDVGAFEAPGALLFRDGFE